MIALNAVIQSVQTRILLKKQTALETVAGLILKNVNAFQIIALHY